MTKEEFINHYVEKSELTPEKKEEFLKTHFACPCENCDYDGCSGWQMVNRELYKKLKEDGIIPNYDSFL